MSKYFKNGEWKGTLLCLALIAPIPAGIVLALVTGDAAWLWLCAFLIFFLS